MADTLVVTANLANTPTDITDSALAITPFTPGANGVPLGATLTGFTVGYAETINGDLTISNSGNSSSGISGRVDSLGLLYLFTSAAAHGDLPIDPLAPPTDDAFAGAGPDPFFKKSATLAPGGVSGPTAYTKSASAVTGLDTTGGDLALVQAAWNVYISTATNVATTATGSGNGVATYDNNVSGIVTVTYDYTAPSSTPEPATMILFGSALIGLGLLRKRATK